MAWTNDTLKVDNRDIPIQRGEIEQTKLKFYPSNPRLYSIIRPDEKEPDQEEIEHKLIGMEHVKALIQDIKTNGGLIDPIIVKDGTLEVLEGNSRLAAYRRLAEVDPIKWGKLKCILLPKSISDSLVFRILGQYHIVGKKNWAPFEQAGFLYRRNKNDNISQEQIAKELGLSLREVKSLVATYEFMVVHKDTDVSRWSYYYELLKSRKIASISRKHSDFIPSLVKKIKQGIIKKAVDIRDEVPKLAGAREPVIKGFIDGNISLGDAVGKIERSGGTDDKYLRLKKFRTWLVEAKTEEQFENAKESAKKKIIYELNVIERHAKRIKARLNDE